MNVYRFKILCLYYKLCSFDPVERNETYFFSDFQKNLENFDGKSSYVDDIS